MPGRDDSPTELSDSQPLTELAGTAAADTQSAYAWSEIDEGDLPEVTETAEGRSWIPSLVTSAVVMASLAIVGAAAAVAYEHLRSAPVPIVVASTPPPVTVTPETTVAPATSYLPPIPIQTDESATVWVPTPSVTPTQIESAAETAAHDSAFLDLMRSDNWSIGNPSTTTSVARNFCTELRQGVSPTVLNRRIADANGFSMSDALIFTANAMIAYPGCRFGAGR